MENSPLRQAIEDLPLGKPLLSGEPLDLWASLGKGCLTTWALELERDLEIAAARLGTARERSRIEEIGLNDPEAPGRIAEAAEPLEGALWRVAAAREKLEVVVALAFGVRAFTLEGKAARLEPDVKGLKALLAGFTEGEAARFRDAALALVNHPAIRLRHQLMHSLAPIAGTSPIFYVQTGHRYPNGEVYLYTLRPVYPEGTLRENAVTPQQVFARAHTLTSEALDLLLTATAELPAVLRKRGRLDRPPLVYWDVDGAVSPASDDSTT